MHVCSCYCILSHIYSSVKRNLIHKKAHSKRYLPLPFISWGRDLEHRPGFTKLENRCKLRDNQSQVRQAEGTLDIEIRRELRYQIEEIMKVLEYGP
jgi:hypothetical protein